MNVLLYVFDDNEGFTGLFFYLYSTFLIYFLVTVCP